MAYHTVTYLFVFLPLALCLYQLVPQRTRWIVLLFFGYLFVWTFNERMVLWLIGTSLFTHYICVWITWAREKNTYVCKKILTFGIVLLLTAWGYVKYFDFFVANLNRISEVTGLFPKVQTIEVLLPIGVSFYTLQAIGHMIDVGRQRAEVCVHPGKTMLFLGFFPQIMEGPISSYGQTADALFRGEPIRVSNLSEGSLRILWGLFKKLIIADRLYVLVDKVFDHYTEYHGAVIAAAAIAYTIQLYMEFSGCMDIVIGSGWMFGIRLPENFRQPFFAVDAADFWQRWHITLGLWLRTYVFFPVSVSKTVKRWTRFSKPRCGKYVAKIGTLAIALFPVWLCNGLWHGARWSYIFFGMYYFVVLLLTAIFDPLRDRVLKRLHISKDASWYKAIRILKTWIIIFTGELFFRAEGLQIGIQMFRSMFRDFSLSQLTAENWPNMGLDRADYYAVIVACAVVAIVEFIKEKGVLGNNFLQKMHLPVRWAIYYGLIISIVIFGAYGIGYQKVDLIYAGFNYKFRNVIKGVTFFLILAMLFVIMSLVTENVLMDRDRLVPVRNKNFYRIRREKTDSIDVIIVGNSLSYSAISPMGFWREHGFTAYACGQSGQTIRETEEMLKTALSVQTPRVVILETDVLFNKNNQITRKNLDKNIGSTLGYYVPVLRGHDIWKSLIIKKGYSDNSFKGFAVRPNVAAYKKGDYMSESGEKEEISETTLDYMDRIINMCEGVGAELILVGTPSPDNYNYAKHKVIEEYAKEKSLISLDMNMLLEEVGIDWKTDSLDKGDHLNLSGAEKVTIYLGRFLTEKCELPDHRGDPAYKSWAEESEKYEESIAPILKEIRGTNTSP